VQALKSAKRASVVVAKAQGESGEPELAESGDPKLFMAASSIEFET